jgi:hypothetical protein
MAYYFLLRRACQRDPDLRQCFTRCRHCRIFFLLHPRNRGRKDLGCPFGCREAHRKDRSSRRSTAYYQTPSGKRKKAQLNGRRRGSTKDRGHDLTGAAEVAEPEEAEFDAGIVEHVRVVVSLVEGSEISREEVVAMLERIMRQHSIVRERPQDYLLRRLAELPP